MEKTISGKYSLLVCDVDGTIMDRQHHITQETKDALDLLRAHGIGVTLATGRNYWEAFDIAKELEITLPVILANGAQIYDFTSERLLYTSEMDVSAIKKFLHHLDHREIVYLRWYDGQQWHWGSAQDFVSSDATLVVKQFLLSGGAQERWLVDDESNPFWIFWDGENHYELTPKTANKGAGLLKLCNLLALDRQMVVAIGNDRNDQELLQTAGVGLGVADGHPDIFRSADALVAPMGENPVVYIAEWMLGKLPWERIVMSK